MDRMQVIASIRAILTEAQTSLDALGIPTSSEGRYDLAFHQGLRKALARFGADEEHVSGDPTTVEQQIADMETQGPPGWLLAALLHNNVLAPFWIRVAWAWWCVRRHETVPEAAYVLIEEGNARLYDDGDQPLRPQDAEEFIGDRRAYTPPSIWIPVSIAAVILVGVGIHFYRKHRRALLEGNG